MLTEDQMRKINAERRRNGNGVISRDQAETAAREAGHSGNSALEFCLGLSGVPWPSAMGITGFVIHEMSSPASASEPSSSTSDTSSSDSSGGGDYGGGGSDSSF